MMRLSGLTIATTNMRQMVRFYNAVFDARLKATVHIGDEQFYGGKIGALELTLCPNEIAGVVAQQNRQQLRFEVRDIERAMERGLACHGSEINPIDEYKGAKVASLADPDGNTIEFVQLVS
ncbi:MAG: VOC family protein [Chloroflexi bacterium]|nr:VOC family protein [Chloroflexota bacterium]